MYTKWSHLRSKYLATKLHDLFSRSVTTLYTLCIKGYALLLRSGTDVLLCFDFFTVLYNQNAQTTILVFIII